MKKVLVSTICVFLCSCAYTPAERYPEAEKARNDYISLQSSLTRLPSGKNSCTSSTFKVAESNADLLEARMMGQYVVTINPKYSNTQQRHSKEQLDIITPLAARARFDVADKALELGCKSIAKKHYRTVLEVFVGMGYGAYRDRAKMGLADIRS